MGVCQADIFKDTFFGVDLLFSLCVCLHLDSAKDEEDYSDEDEEEDVGDGGGSVGNEERQPATNSEDRVVVFPASAICNLPLNTLPS